MTVGGRSTKDDVSFATWASGQRSPSGGKQGSIQGSYYPACIGNVMRWSLLAVSGWKARAYRGSFWEKRREKDYNRRDENYRRGQQGGHFISAMSSLLNCVLLCQWEEGKIKPFPCWLLKLPSKNKQPDAAIKVNTASSASEEAQCYFHHLPAMGTMSSKWYSGNAFGPAK